MPKAVIDFSFPNFSFLLSQFLLLIWLLSGSFGNMNLCISDPFTELRLRVQKLCAIAVI